MKILIVEPLKIPYTKEISGSLASMQAVVGGYIQAIYPFEDGELALICNEEGKLVGLPFNRALRDEEGRVYDIVAGTFFLCRAPAEGENFEGLTERQIRWGEERFRYPELFLPAKGT
jgi:hypothetical protein